MRCCQTATEDEIEEDPTAYDCGRCERTLQAQKLWPENAEAWRLYQTLCGRTVKHCELHGWVLDAWFLEDRSFEARAAMLKRLDLIGVEFDQRDEGRGDPDGRRSES